MIWLHAVEWLTITGRGHVALCDTPLEDLSVLKGETVLIDGTGYKVRGIESFYPRKPSSPYGILVHGRKLLHWYDWREGSSDFACGPDYPSCARDHLPAGDERKTRE